MGSSKIVAVILGILILTAIFVFVVPVFPVSYQEAYEIEVPITYQVAFDKQDTVPVWFWQEEGTEYRTERAGYIMTIRIYRTETHYRTMTVTVTLWELITGSYPRQKARASSLS